VQSVSIEQFVLHAVLLSQVRLLLQATPVPVQLPAPSQLFWVMVLPEHEVPQPVRAGAT
jgi:hypothetical protein